MRAAATTMMMTTTTQKVRRRDRVRAQLDAVLRFVRPQLAFANCHMVGYLTEGLWQQHVPAAIRNAVRSAEDVDAALSVFWAFHREPERFATAAAEGEDDSEAENRFGGLLEHLRAARAHRLGHLERGGDADDDDNDGVVLSADQMHAELLRRRNARRDSNVDGSVNPASTSTLQIKEFMSEKKSHEVEIASDLIASLCANSTSDTIMRIIDAGDGKGYLSSRLALEHRLHVLGIDASATNTLGAQKRGEQLARAWTTLQRRAEDVRDGQPAPQRQGRRRKGKPVQTGDANAAAVDQQQTAALTELYQRSTHFITPQTDFQRLFGEHFPGESTTPAAGFCLSGLHTCGNLAASCAQIFRRNAAVRLLCNVGCCYHLLDEQFVGQDLHVERHHPAALAEGEPTMLGFPLSAHLRKQRFRLGRNARMLASQSLERTVAAGEPPGRSLFYRALLERLICERRPELAGCVQVGRMKGGGDDLTFGEYVRRCAKRLEQGGDALPFDAEAAANREPQLMAELALERRRMELFYLVRQTLAPVLETVVLLDRLLYLLEPDADVGGDDGVESAWLVQLFDPVVSPRSVAVVAIK